MNKSTRRSKTPSPLETARKIIDKARRSRNSDYFRLFHAQCEQQDGCVAIILSCSVRPLLIDPKEGTLTYEHRSTSSSLAAQRLHELYSPGGD